MIWNTYVSRETIRQCFIYLAHCRVVTGVLNSSRVLLLGAGMKNGMLFQWAEDCYAEGDYKAALELFTKLSRTEETEECLNYIGCCQLCLGNYTDAIARFETLIAHNPTWIRPIFNLGRVYLALGQPEKALPLFQSAERMNAFHVDALYYLGVYYDSIKDYQTAKKYYKRSLRIQYEQSECHQNLGVCYLTEGAYALALSEFEIAYRQDASNLDALYCQAFTLMYLNRHREALVVLMELHRQRPSHTEYLKDMMHCCCKLKYKRQAMHWNRVLYKRQPENGSVLRVIARYHKKPQRKLRLL